LVERAVVVVVLEVEVDLDVEVEEVLTLVVDTEVLEVERLVELVELDTEVVLVLDDVLLVEVLEVEVLLVELEVELVLVLEVEVDVVTLSRGRSSPRANLYTRPTTPAEALSKLAWLIARMYGSTARDRSFSWPVLSL
jgi:hypothetical protein